VQLTTARVAVHSIAGCFFYGAFTAKVLLAQSRRLPGWTLPAAGGALAILVAVLWHTSALWYYKRLPAPLDQLTAGGCSPLAVNRTPPGAWWAAGDLSKSR
jgi:Family of unknown function (DUF6529)